MLPINPWAVVVTLLGLVAAMGAKYGNISARLLAAERDVKALKTEQAATAAAVAELEKGQVRVLAELGGIRDLLIEIKKGMGK